MALGPRDGQADPQRLDAGGGVGLVEALGDDDLRHAGPDGGDGGADACVLYDGPAACHDRAERRPLGDVQAVEA